ncbi:hypothetical protein NL676_014370 [Syzygium grande]|nr:hypothetical protein NL676_014370 [Syzygium grande]
MMGNCTGMKDGFMSTPGKVKTSIARSAPDPSHCPQASRERPALDLLHFAGTTEPFSHSFGPILLVFLTRWKLSLTSSFNLPAQHRSL